ncbi:SLATT domain-containing protein [Candidatus Halobonum tyrrellensis]|nr:SLATT domain-containing protein [Candidatus Halobonum tyrrellensis]
MSTNEPPNADAMRERCAEMMNGLRYTFKTHYKMAEAYEKIGIAMNLLVAVGTAAIVVSLLWDAVSQQILITIAFLVAIGSWSQAVLKLGVKSQKHFSAGDRHHALYEDFKSFIDVEMHDDDTTISEKRERFRELTRTRDQINQMSPRTTNFWYNRLSEKEAQATAGSDAEEVNAILKSD